MDRAARARDERAVGFSFDLESGAAQRHAAALGRQQHDGRGAQQERRLRHRHHAADDRRAKPSGASRTGCSPRSRRSIHIRSMQSKAARGAPLYKEYCAACHGAGGARLHRRVRRQGHADRRDRAPTAAGSTRTPTSSRSISRRSTPAIPGASRISARPSATPTCRSTASGCARRTCTTARCRRCAICSSPQPKRPTAVLSRLRRVRPGEGRLRLGRRRGERQEILQVRLKRAGQRQRRARGQALRHRACARTTRTRWSNILKTF